MPVQPAQLEKDVRYLTETIGIRTVGSSGEKEAVDYLSRRFAEYCPSVHTEAFPARAATVTSLVLELRIGDAWKAYNGILFNGSPTTDGLTLEAETVWFDSHTDYEREDLSFVTGKAVILLGVHFPSEKAYRRMMAARPAFLLIVDVRYTGTAPLGDGLFPAYADAYGAVPCVNVAYFDAWDWAKQKADRARLTVTGKAEPCEGYNVIAELPGTDPDAGTLFFTAHHDTQSGTPGADDNAIGCAVILELARLFSQVPHRATLQFIAFGAEEQLSLGSAWYVRAHREQLEKSGQFVCNFDSCGTGMGWNDFFTNLNDDLCDYVRTVLHSHDVFYREHRAPEATNDLFPFTVVGIPGITFIRQNCESGKFYHHRFDNTLDRISPETAAGLADAAAALVTPWIDRTPSVELSVDQATGNTVQALWQSVFGGWK